MKLYVEDMSCNHCVMKIQKQLILDGNNAKVELSDKSVTFQKESDLEKVVQSIEKAGYTVKK
ncbi:MAG: heavy-metal-associated domain-containing protein [Acholeplasmataceae bacterium]|nr:heavy-metal-associated domain-containing protein [Acholeplasmataceae bacterium]